VSIASCPNLAPYSATNLTTLSPNNTAEKRHWENLALACMQCNRCKGPNIASVDRETKLSCHCSIRERNQWSEHFRLDGGRIIPLTNVGRATAALLEINRTERAETRHNLWLAGRYGPPA